MTQPAAQLDMFGHVLGAYAATAERPMDNASLYQAVAQRAGLDQAAVTRVEPIGEAATPRNVFHRQVRWYQQSLKALGLIERVEGKRGVWQLTDKARRDLHPIRRPLKVIAFSTDLGVAMWSAAEDVFSALEVPITLCFTSPPYPCACRVPTATSMPGRSSTSCVRRWRRSSSAWPPKPRWS
ncbi:winged helix-turn-helix domain-containing protein [Halomonas sp. E19]|uniref:winged helix-turn-helix domain-containing protein n=1 Tax=Halomonas sp. E19 TaxID=3397247 RepID=UPI0040349047